MAPVGILRASMSMRWPLYGRRRVWFRIVGVVGFWKPSRFQWTWVLQRWRGKNGGGIRENGEREGVTYVGG